MSNLALRSPQIDDQESFVAEPDVGVGNDGSEAGDAANFERARPIPRISIQAFCEDNRTSSVLEAVGEDRRLARAHVSVHMGGLTAAVSHYQEAPSPNLIIIESMADRSSLLTQLDMLAEYCDGGTKVVVIGHSNDVLLYRELLRRGVSEYVVAPVTPMSIMESITNLYSDPQAEPVGHVISFIGAKGGVGSSTVCHNTAWAISRILSNNVVIADLDLPFGTAGLDFNQDPMQGVADALSSPERLDQTLLDRLLSKCTDHLSLFAAPGVLDRNYDIPNEAYSTVIDVVRQSVPFLAIDVPHVWNTWSKEMLIRSDDIVITVMPDLANLRNAKNMVDLLKQARKNDRKPIVVVNQVGMPKRPEITVKEFADALELEPKLVIEFDPENFGMAANNGQMIEELNKKAKGAERFRELAGIITNRTEPKKKEESKSMFKPLLARFNRKKA